MEQLLGFLDFSVLVQVLACPDFFLMLSKNKYVSKIALFTVVTVLLIGKFIFQYSQTCATGHLYLTATCL